MGKSTIIKIKKVLNYLKYYQNRNSDSQGLDLSKWLKKELTKLSIPYTDPCCPANMFYVGYVDYFNSGGGIFKKTSDITCTESNSTNTQTLILNSLKVNGIEYVSSPITNSVGNPFQDTLALYNSLSIPGATFKIVSAVNYAGIYEPYANTTKEANAYWIVMSAPNNVTSVESSFLYSGVTTINIVNQKAIETEFFDVSNC